MKLVHVAPQQQALAMELYRYGLAWTPVSMVSSDIESLWGLAYQHPASIWRLAVNDAGQVVGLGGVEQISTIDQSAQPYISVVPDVRGQGVGTQLGLLLRDFAVNVLNIRRAHSTVLVDAPSRKILEKLGFKQEGQHKAMRYRNGEWVDAVTYAWLRE